MTPPVILVPGFWLGAWAWDGVAALLRDEGLDVQALTLPGLEAMDVDRSTITLADHVDAIVKAVECADSRVVLAVHSGASVPGYSASDRVPERIAAMVYVDTAPGKGAIDAEFAGIEKPLPSPEELAASESLAGLSEEQLATFRRRAVPEPGAALREAPVLNNEARLDVPSILIATGYTSADYKAYAKEGYSWLAGLNELRNITYVDLPTSHWPMWSRPRELAQILTDTARRSA